MTEVSYPLWSDNPSAVDLVGFDAISAPVIDAIGRCPPRPRLCRSLRAVGLRQVHAARPHRSRARGSGRRRDRPRPSRGSTTPRSIRRPRSSGTSSTSSPRRTSGVGVSTTARLAGLVKKVRWTKAISPVARSALTVSLPNWGEVEGLFNADYRERRRIRRSPGSGTTSRPATREADYLSRRSCSSTMSTGACPRSPSASSRRSSCSSPCPRWPSSSPPTRRPLSS